MEVPFHLPAGSTSLRRVHNKATMSSGATGAVQPADEPPTEARPTVITAKNLTKTYGDVAAVDGISFSVPAGESFGLLGPNGAGKSTTMKMIGGVTRRTSGALHIMGLDPDSHGPEVRAHLGVVPQQDNLDEELRVRDNLLVYGRYFGLPMSYLKPKPMSCWNSPS